MLELALEDVAGFGVALPGEGALALAKSGEAHAFVRLGQIAVAVAVYVERIAVGHKPHARRRLRAKD